MRSLSFLLVLVLVCVIGYVSADTPCKVDGTSYTCPVILSKLDRWGVEYRHYEALQLLGYIPQSGPLSGSATQALQTGLQTIQGYFSGQNRNGSTLQPTRPVGLEIYQIAPTITYYVPFAFLPTAVYGNPPQPTSSALLSTSPLPPGAFDPIAMTFSGQATDALIASTLAELRSVLDKHGELYDPQVSFFFTYMTQDTTTYPNEVWQLPEDSEYAKERISQLMKIIKQTQ